MRLVIAKSTFDHPETDATVSPGQPLLMEGPIVDSLIKTLHVEPPRPEVHFQVDEGPKTEDGQQTAIYHKGGGTFLVLDDSGEVLNEDTIRGRDNAEEFAANYSSDE